MRVTVFGATGAIGRHVVAELLQHGHEVTAYARDLAKLPADWDQRVRVVLGAITDPTSVDAAIAGADAVVSALGPSMARSATGLPLVEGTRLIVESMLRHGVDRYVGLGTPSVHDVRDRVGLRVRAIGVVARVFLPRAYEELLGMTRAVTEAPIDWTIVRFTAPTDGPRTGRLRVGYFGSARIGFRVSRADIAAFTAAQIDDRAYSRSAPAISD